MTAAAGAKAKGHRDKVETWLSMRRWSTSRWAISRDMMVCGNLAEIRHRGLLRVEGREYQIHDGEVVTILFHT
ncbi:MAG: DUF933 domain-containing protein [Chloroflexi bacterium]|nr:DUF933 domain-containing protein [Chloroflexota bacterium]